MGRALGRVPLLGLVGQVLKETSKKINFLGRGKLHLTMGIIINRITLKKEI